MTPHARSPALGPMCSPAWQDDWSHLFAGPLAMPSLKAKRVVGEDGGIPDKVLGLAGFRLGLGLDLT